jgi:hypothetical protein
VLGTQSSIFCEELRLIGAVVGGRRSCGSCGWLQTPVAGLFLLIVLLTEISLIRQPDGPGAAIFLTLAEKKMEVCGR